MSNINLYNSDCLVAMRGMKDKQYQLAIVDPPYGINIAESLGGSDYFAKNEKKSWDKERPNNDYFVELFRVSANQIIWGGNYFSNFLPPSSGWVFWDKNNGSSTFSDGELAFTSFSRALRMKRLTWCGSSSRQKEE